MATHENEIAMAVLRVAGKQPNGVATFKRLYKEIPNVIALDRDDRAASQTRNGEEMWQQIVRNIKSHDKTEGNYIAEGWLESVPRVGYRITTLGKKKLLNC
ncbi:MAG: hypothetical protein KGN33_05295 [Paracoccaceae bacterium]|nr:hypothetical protein [Paracoccaceae bacterium]